jgi:replicative superfamily II helicase
LLKYLDPEFLDATTDGNPIDTELLAMKTKGKINLTLETNNTKPNSNDSQSRGNASMAPREYQYELFQKAVSENIIAVLGTGAGKTLISVMLIKHISSIERQQRLNGQKVSIMFWRT